MKHTIKRWDTGAVLFEHDCETQRECVEKAVRDGVSLCRASLDGASLYGASLYGASLDRASLYGASLYGASLDGASLYGASLDGASLYGASLCGANLDRASLYGASLCRANLDRAGISDLQKARLSILPDCGDVIGWKSCRDNVVVKLLIREGTPRSNAMGRKCRAESAEVLEVFGAEVGYSKNPNGGERLEYRKGAIVKCVKPFDTNRWNECASGIHFYITRVEAEND